MNWGVGFLSSLDTGVLDTGVLDTGVLDTAGFVADLYFHSLFDLCDFIFQITATMPSKIIATIPTP